MRAYALIQSARFASLMRERRARACKIMQTTALNINPSRCGRVESPGCQSFANAKCFYLRKRQRAGVSNCPAEGAVLIYSTIPPITRENGEYE